MKFLVQNTNEKPTQIICRGYAELPPRCLILADK